MNNFENAQQYTIQSLIIQNRAVNSSSDNIAFEFNDLSQYTLTQNIPENQIKNLYFNID